jgi:flotillin
VRDTRKIEADLAVKRRNTEMERDLQIVAQESAIAVATKSKEQSEAQTIAETAAALAIAAEEKVTTARATEIAERDKIINVIAARKAAETEAMPITVMAEGRKPGRQQQGGSHHVLAKADADAAITRRPASNRSARPRRGGGAEGEARNKLSRKWSTTISLWRASTSSERAGRRRSSRSRRFPTSGSSTPAACSAAAAATAP